MGNVDWGIDLDYLELMDNVDRAIDRPNILSHYLFIFAFDLETCIHPLKLTSAELFIYLFIFFSTTIILSPFLICLRVKSLEGMEN